MSCGKRSESVAMSLEEDFSNSSDDLAENDDSYCDETSVSTGAKESLSSSSSTRQGRRAAKRRRYLAGTSRKAYRISNELQQSFEDSDTCLSNSQSMACHVEHSEWNKNVCKSCAPVLQKYADTFKGIKRQGSELKRRKCTNPHPKKPSTQQYRDLVRQNEWLRNNIFDAVGNYLFCCRCVHHALGISFQRLSRQRTVKRKQFAKPLCSLTKSEVEAKNLSQYVVMPQGCEMSFMAWWKLLESSSIVTVQYPHERHGHAGKISHAAKVDAKKEFLTFVDLNSQPNGRSADSTSATHYFLPKFRTIQTPKAGVSNYEQRVQQSLVGEFNRAQVEQQKSTISNYSASVWLKKERPKYSVYPHKLDYCDTCAKKKELLRSKQTTLNRICQTGSADENQQKQIENEMSQISAELEVHCEQARKSHDYYKEVTDRCNKDWAAICELESKANKNQQENENLEKLRHNFTVVLSADYQMQKLVPYWGQSPQPGSTYYLQKLSHDIFGIVDHRDNHSTIYIFDETVGPKNTDHTISLLTYYIRNGETLPLWIKRVHVFLDNTGSTNKNAYFMGWAMEMVQHKMLDYLRISFLIAGHTKFDVDRLFSVTAKSYNSSDVFNTQELISVMSQSDNITALLENGNLILNWREKVATKYTKLPGIRERHDFIIVRSPDTGCATMLVRDHCYGGAAQKSTMKLNSDVSSETNVIPGENENYIALNKKRELTATKLSHLTQMCNNFIPEGRWIEYVR